MTKPETNEAEQAGTASLEKVRDMLFGVQMRDYDKRFTRLEEKLAKEVADLKEDLRKRLVALEGYTKKELESLEERLKTSNLDDQLAKSQKELRQQILELNKRLSDEIRDKAEEILAALTRESQELRNDKADRAALASLLTEMAMRLNDQFRLPGAEGKE